MTDRINPLDARLAAVEDVLAITRLQNQYGYYIDNRMWRELADLFTEYAPEMEIGQRGNSIGTERIYKFRHDVLGQGRWGVMKDEIIHHIELQMVITVADDRRTAKARSRANGQKQGQYPTVNRSR